MWINPLPRHTKSPTPPTTTKNNAQAALETPGAVVVEGEMKIGGQEHFYLEPNATLAIPGEVRGWGCVVYAYVC